MAARGAPRPGNARPPPGYDPNIAQQNPHFLPNNMQNLNPNRPPPPSMLPNPGPGSRPPPNFAQPRPSGFGAPNPFSRPGHPPAALARPVQPPHGTAPPTLPPNVVPGRPGGPPGSQPPPFGARPSSISNPGGLVDQPAALSGQPMAAAQSAFPTSPNVPPSSVLSGQVGNERPMFPPGAFPGGSPFPSGGGAMQPPFVRPPPTMGSTRAPLQAPSMNSPASAQPGGQVLSAPPPGFQPPPGSHYGPQTWQMQPGQAAPSPPVAGSMQPPRMFGMPPPLQNQHMTATRPAMGHIGAPTAESSKIDPNQIPRPIPDSTFVYHETRHDNQANPPPPATGDYIVKDTGNCSPRYMRCTINQIPCTLDLLNSSGMQLALLVQPLALPHPSEEPIQIVDIGESDPVRCSRCKGYINPFMRFTDRGRRFICNFCGFTDETPRDYVCDLGPDGRRRDTDQRPELCRGTVEFVASRDYMVRDPMPPVYFFLIDVSMNAIQTGATAAACNAINQVLSDLAEGSRTMVGIATFDSTIHFYSLRRALQQPLMLIIPDVQDVYTPLQTDIIVQLSECRQHLEFLLENIPSRFQDNKTADSAFGAAIMAAFLALKTTGGKLLVFQSVLPSIGIGALSAREAEGRSNISAGEKETQMLLQPADETLKTMAIEFAEYQVCVDVFITSVTYVDIASISVIPTTTGGQVYYYYPFSAISDSAKLYNDLRWNVIRPQGFEAVMRVRCSQGIEVQEYFGNFCKRIPTDVDLPGIDCDKTIMVTLMHEDRLQDGLECSFQCALLYTTLNGQARIRVSTLSLTCTNTLSNLFRSADLDAQFACLLKQVAYDIPSSPLLRIREQITSLCIKVLLSYRKFCAAVSSSGQLILPEALKLLPLYSLALIKSTGLRSDGRIDDRSFWISYVASISTPLAIPLVYPRMVAIHDLNSKDDESVIPPVLPLSSENVNEEGIFLLENGEDCLIYIGNSVDREILQKLFGTTSVDEIPSQLVLQQHDNPLSRKLNDLVNEIRRQRCSYLRIKMCRKGDPTGVVFFSYMIEDKNLSASSYMEFLVHIHRQILTKMS